MKTKPLRLRISVRLCILLGFALLLLPPVIPQACAVQSNTFSVVNFNVAGLPDFGALLGNHTKDAAANQVLLGEQLNAMAYDIIAVQEDFSYHALLTGGLADYPYATPHSGGIPGGDGMNLYCKYPLYNATRITWDDAFGVIDNGADEMTPKGILYAVIELEDGVLLDFYNIHADAFDDAGSRLARQSNFAQLAQLICDNSASCDRPVIVTGDFNTYLHLSPEHNSNLWEILLERVGLKDAWTELFNQGDYSDYSAWEDCGSPWGNWDSVEMILYKSGGGVTLEAMDFSYLNFWDREGNALSDHAAATATLSYVKTECFAENTEPLTVTKSTPVKDTLRAVKYFFMDLWKILKNWEQFTAYFQ